MPLISAYNLTRQFGERVLFSGVTFDIGEHDRIGLVGENGCGSCRGRFLTIQKTKIYQ